MKINGPIIYRDGMLQSPWQHALINIKVTSDLKKIENIYDTLIVGGGITGLTVALLLQETGHNIILSEAHTIGFGTTGGTSAHINTFADTTYKEAESAFGEDGAKLFAGAIREGFDIIKHNID